MMVTSLSFTYTQVSAAAPTTATRQRMPEAQAQPVARDEGRRASDMPQRSPMYRALKEALAAMAQTATSAAASPSTSQPTEAAATHTEKAAADDAPALNLDEALANFAQALMQALRDQFGSRRESDSEHGDGHHHHHHHHGRRGWGDPAQRVDTLAQQVGATAPAAADNVASAAAAAGAGADTSAVAAETAVPATTPAPATPSTEPVQADAAATSTADAAVGSRVTINVTLNVVLGQESTTAKSPFQGLLDAFAKLQKALGQPADDADALPQRLSAFLQALADKLRGEDAASTDVATQPGTLISVTA